MTTAYITSQIDFSSAPEQTIYIEGSTNTTSAAGYQTMFNVYDSVMSAPQSKVEAYKIIGWYTEPVRVMYAANGDSIVIPKTQKNEYKNAGWFANKNEIDLEGNRSKIDSLVYSSAQTGSLTGTITYQYNKFIGTRADVGAEVMLIQTNHIPLDSDRYNIPLFDNHNDPMIHCTKVDGAGNYYLDNIPAGEYYLFIQSKEAYEAPNIAPINSSMIETYLEGIVTDEAIDSIKMSSDLYCFAVERIEIKPNQTERYSEDWGYSY